MQYAVLIYETPEQFNHRADQHAPEYMGAYEVYSEALAKAGAMAGGACLEPPTTATTIRVGKDGPVIQDGPFMDSKEILGGFYLIECDNLNEAIEWGAKCPAAANACVEVRPIMPMQEAG